MTIRDRVLSSMCILGFTLFMAGNALSQQKPMLKDGG